MTSDHDPFGPAPEPDIASADLTQDGRDHLRGKLDELRAHLAQDPAAADALAGVLRAVNALTPFTASLIEGVIALARDADEAHGPIYGTTAEIDKADAVLRAALTSDCDCKHAVIR